MAARTGGLGRGLGELFINTADDSDEPDSPAALADGSTYQMLPVSKIRPNPKQVRQTFDPDELDELAASIADVGLLQPIVVRDADDGYELIMGERRWRAHKQAGIEEIPAIIRGTDDDQLLLDALLENLHRVQLNPIEEASAYQQMLTDFNCSQETLAHKVKKSRPHISNSLRLLKLPVSIQRRVAAGVLSAGHARAIMMLSDPVKQEHLAQRIVAESLSVRSAEEIATLMENEREVAVPTRPRAPRSVPDDVQRHADDLADRLDTRVHVSVGGRKGKLSIEFADAEDLERIMNLLESGR